MAVVGAVVVVNVMAMMRNVDERKKGDGTAK
jgi:hypothetical protein